MFKKILSIVIIFIAIGGYSIYSASTVDQNVNIDFSSVNVGQNFILSLDEGILNNANITDTDKIEALNKILTELNKYGIVGSLEGSSNNKPYIEMKGSKSTNIDISIPHILKSVNGQNIVWYNVNIKGKVTKIPTRIDLKASTEDIDNSTEYSGTVKTDNYYDGWDLIQPQYVKEIKMLKVNIRSIDSNNEPVDKVLNVLVDNNGNFKFKLSNVPTINKNRPGEYLMTINTNLNSSSMYADSELKNQFRNIHYYYIKPVQGGYSAPSQYFTAPVKFNVTDYFGKPLVGANLKIYNRDVITDEIGSFIYNDVISFDYPTYLKKSYSIKSPDFKGSNAFIVDGDFDINFGQEAGDNKTVCVQAAHSGFVWDTRTFHASNGITLSGTGGILGFVAKYRVDWYDVNKEFIKSTGSCRKTSGDCSEVIKKVPSGAVFAEYSMWADCKSVRSTDLVSAGDGAMFFEGPIGGGAGANSHLIGLDPNGVRVIKRDWKS